MKKSVYKDGDLLIYKTENHTAYYGKIYIKLGDDMIPGLDKVFMKLYSIFDLYELPLERPDDYELLENSQVKICGQQ